MTWPDLGAASLLAIAFLILPGLMIAWVAGVRGFLAVALAPALSTTAIAGGAVTAGLLGVRWAWWVPLATALMLSGGLWLVLRLARRLGIETAVRPAMRCWRRDLPMWAGVVIAGLLITRQLGIVLTRPDAFSQTFDNIFHMAAVRYVVETGNASSLAIGGVTQIDGDPAFYPAAFHALASLVFDIGPGGIAVAVNAAAVAICALVWPLACLALIRLALPESSASVLGASVLAASFSTFPILLLDFGVLYPNLYGLAFVPAMYGLIVQLLGLHTKRYMTPAVAGALLLVMIPGLVLAHPNALLVLMATAVAPVLAWFVRRWRWGWSSNRRMRAVALPSLVVAGFFAVLLTAWRFVRPPEEAATWPPIVSAPQALGEALLSATPGGGRAAWLVGVLVVAGVVVALRSGRWWLVGSWGTIVALWIVVASFGQSDLRTYLTGIWYNDPLRFSATIPLVSLPLGALAAHAAGQRIASGHGRLGSRLRSAADSHSAYRVLAAAAIPLAFVTVLIVGTQRAPYMQASLAGASTAYVLTPDSPLVTTDEYALLLRVPGEVGEDAVVATNPWNGSSMLYPFTGIRTTTTHTLYDPTEDQATIRAELDEIADSAAACEAARRVGVTHVLDFGPQELHNRSESYPGLLDLGDADGFREVDREGTVVLYELTMCR